MNKIVLIIFSFFISLSSLAQQPDYFEQLAKDFLPTFKNSPYMIDQCALKLVHQIDFDKQTGWPAYCNFFEKNELVISRVNELNALIKKFNISQDELSKLASGKIWINAPVEYATLSWGTPKDINRTITESSTSEQWVYDSSYLYITNGRVIAIQN